MKNNMKIALFIENIFNEFEVVYPYYRLIEEGYEVVVIGRQAEEYHGKYGLPFKADIGISEARAEDFDALVIPGGFAPDYMRRSEKMVSFVRGIFNAGKPVASICHGAWMLVSADVLKGKNATCYSGIKDDVQNAGANYSDEEVVVDDNLITSRQPSDLPAFCGKIVEALKS